MKQADDNKICELVLPIELVKRRRGRPPASGVAMSNAERQKAHRDRLAASGEHSITLVLPADVLAALEKFVQFKDERKSDVIARIVRDRLMRSR